MDYSPKEVLVDFDSMSGLVIFENFNDYNETEDQNDSANE